MNAATNHPTFRRAAVAAILLVLAAVALSLIQPADARAVYHPRLGRFLQRDPSNYAEGANCYEYVRSSPVSRLDHEGLASQGDTGSSEVGSEATQPEEECGLCGPDVTAQVKKVIAKVQRTWRRWSHKQRREHCKAIFSDEPYPQRPVKKRGKMVAGPTWLMAWDIDKLWRGGNDWINRPPYGPPCAQPQTGRKKCKDTVEVDNKCYYSGSVNYVLWGWIHRLCRHRQQLVEVPIKLYKGGHIPGRPKAKNFEVSLDWALAGYYGWPGFKDVDTPEADRPHCATNCPITYTGPAFKFHWAPMTGWK